MMKPPDVVSPSYNVITDRCYHPPSIEDNEPIC